MPVPAAAAAGVTPDAREVLRRLELDVSRRLDGLLQGDHRGLVPGHGTELGETRRYAPGDDVRRIDWNVTARLPEPHIRQTIAERELRTWLVIDRSARLAFGTALAEKRSLVLAAAAAIGFLTQRDGNLIGAAYAGPGRPTVIPPRGSRRHFLRILHDVAGYRGDDGAGVTDLRPALARVTGGDSRRGLLVVISDFLVAPGWESDLRVAARRHDVLAIQVTDPRESELPNVGMVVLRDPATGEAREVATHRRRVREGFAAAARARQEQLEASLGLARVDHLVLSTGRPWLDDLVAFVAGRRHRLRILAGRSV
jgi:uncharacterized protein (DUF58 family)